MGQVAGDDLRISNFPHGYNIYDQRSTLYKPDLAFSAISFLFVAFLVRNIPCLFVLSAHGGMQAWISSDSQPGRFHFIYVKIFVLVQECFLTRQEVEFTNKSPCLGAPTSLGPSIRITHPVCMETRGENRRNQSP